MFGERHRMSVPNRERPPNLRGPSIAASTALQLEPDIGHVGAYEDRFPPMGLVDASSTIDAYPAGDVQVMDLQAPFVLAEPVGDEAVSRAINVFFAILGLVLTSPMLVVIAILIKLDSPGPFLHTQQRVGLDRRWRSMSAVHQARRHDLGGRVFTIYKLRTMHEDAERESGAVWASREDPRITRTGRFLRKYRFDEIPQLWNVILGDMNIVGPRPERPAIVASLRQHIPEYQLRHRVKPGITGLAQINQSYDASLDDVRSKVSWDLAYIQRRSLWLDIEVMVLTIPTVLLKMRGW
jgi:lipopolysaccharide/colanic/teichoic acid biosynthesis glycosyltransferase